MTCQLSRQSISLLRKWPLVRIQHESPLNYVIYLGRLAQLVERYPYKVDVISSSLISTTIIIFVGPFVQWLGSMVFIHVTGVQVSQGSPTINSYQYKKCGCSSAGQNICLSRRGPRVRISSTAPLFLNQNKIHIFNITII